jgi:hypothetical protein
MPPGITRFTVSPRVLRVNYELEALKSTESLEQKNQELKEWLTTKVSGKRVRYYGEPTLLFDE